MKTLIKTAIAAIIAASAAGTAAAQDYQNWDGMTNWGVPMYDQFGDVHYVDPYAYDSQVDMYGNVVSDYNGEMNPYNLGMSELTHAYPNNSYNSGYNSGYVAPSYSAPSFNEYDSTAYTMKESSNWSKGGLYDTSWMFE